MTLYHGSNVRIKKIDLSKSKPFKDFGKGFYLSDVESQAIEMAKFKAMLLGGEPVVTKFEFDEEGLVNAGLSVKKFLDYSSEWLDFVIANRNGEQSVNYDFIYGPIADDNVGLQLQRYNDGNIDKPTLLKRLKYHKGITYQYFFGNEEALKFLKNMDYE